MSLILFSIIDDFLLPLPKPTLPPPPNPPQILSKPHPSLNLITSIPLNHLHYLLNHLLLILQPHIPCDHFPHRMSIHSMTPR